MTERRRGARSLGIGLLLYIPALAAASLYPEWEILFDLAVALGIGGVPLIVLGSYRLVFGGGAPRASVLASLGRIVFGLVVLIATVALALAVVAVAGRA